MRNYLSVLLVVFCLSVNLYAVGALDDNFGRYGKIDAGFGKGQDSNQMRAVAPDGSSVFVTHMPYGAISSYALVKFMPSGALDNSFGSGGVVHMHLHDFMTHGEFGIPRDIAIGPDGSIYVTGGHGLDMAVGKYDASGDLVQVFDGGETGFMLNGSPKAGSVQADGSLLVAGYRGNENGLLTVYRYLSSGALDINFGNGGRAAMPMGWKKLPTSIRAESNGKIVITGWTIPDGSPTPSITQSMIVRLNANGSLDTSFDGDGALIKPVSNGASEVYYRSYTDANGRIAAIGIYRTGEFSTPTHYFSRFSSNGQSDRTFGSRGNVFTDLQTMGDQHSVDFDGNGGMYVTHNGNQVRKFTPNGLPDASFGKQGVHTVEEINSDITLLKTAPNGKLVIGGKQIVEDPFLNGENYDITARRLNSDGSPDGGFGDEGLALCDVGDYTSVIKDVIVDVNQRTIVVGGYRNLDDGEFGTGVARYNADGTADQTFGNRGKLMLTDNLSYGKFNSVALQANGKILIAGDLAYGSSNSNGARVIRLNDDGSKDTTFAVNGTFTYTLGDLRVKDIALQADGKIVLGGDYNGDFVLMRLTADGQLDNEFGGYGIVFTDISGNDQANSLVIQPNGKIILAGASYLNVQSDITMVRYNASGSLDHTFGRRGKVLTDIEGEENDVLHSINLTPDGYIVVSGSRLDSVWVNFFVARYTGKGMLDSGFAGDGIYVSADFQRESDPDFSAQVRSDNSVFVAGQTGEFLGVYKINADGTSDQSWGINGFLNTGIVSDNLDSSPSTFMDGQGRMIIAGSAIGSGGGYVARVVTTK